MQAGKPVLASTSGGHAELIGDDGSCGWLFDWNIENDLINKLKLLIAKDEKALHAVGLAAQKKVRNVCDHQDNLKKRIEYFDRIIKSVHEKNYYPLVDIGHKQISSINMPMVEQSISIIIFINKNEVRVLMPTLRSCLLAGFKNKEITLVNNGNVDQYTMEILAALDKEKFDNLKIVNYSSRQKMANLRNYFAGNSVSQYICFLNSGEIVSDIYFSKAIKLLNEYKNLFFICNNAKNFQAGAELYKNINPEMPWLFFTNNISPGVVYNREIFIGSGRNDEDIDLGYEDYESILNIVKNGFGGMALVDEHVISQNNKNFSLFDKDICADVKWLYRSVFKELPIDTLEKHGIELLRLFNLIKYLKKSDL
jgi:hypothetical protein